MPSIAGKFLVARSLLQDPNFRQTVVLMLQHDTNGAVGLVMNRPTKVKGIPFTVYRGGPCPEKGWFMLHGHAEWANGSDEDSPTEIAPGLYVGDAQCLSRVNDVPDDGTLRFRMFTGYAGWGPDQLEGELAAGAWVVMPANGELVFDTPIEELWDRLSPPTLPQPSLN
jgi:putative transcriptional regulator